jgi:hypothetical protein
MCYQVAYTVQTEFQAFAAFFNPAATANQEQPRTENSSVVSANYDTIDRLSPGI